MRALEPFSIFGQRDSDPNHCCALGLKDQSARNDIPTGINGSSDLRLSDRRKARDFSLSESTACGMDSVHCGVATVDAVRVRGHRASSEQSIPQAVPTLTGMGRTTVIEHPADGRMLEFREAMIPKPERWQHPERRDAGRRPVLSGEFTKAKATEEDSRV